MPLRELIGQILLKSTALTPAQLAEALEFQERQPERDRIGAILVSRGTASPHDLLHALGLQWGLPVMETIPPALLDRQLVMAFPFEFLQKHSILPLTGGNGDLVVALADPLNVTAFDAVANAIQRPCTRVLCTAAALEEALTRCYYQDGDSSSAILEPLAETEDLARAAGEAQTEDLMDVANRAPIVKLVNTIFYQAAASRASDIHIEPYEREVRVRFRIDGVLRERFTPPKAYVGALISRLKIMAHLNIAEQRLPQDGRSRIKIGDKEIDIRVSTIPTSSGERVVLRLLDKSSAVFQLSDLGFAPETETRFRKLTRISHGIVLLTGPTGSGKTTTLYGALTEINTAERNILTAEDPIEYVLPGVGQMQVHPKIGLTFASCLRHILRQDPNVIMVGEIRDRETAEIAVQASLTGHLVFSTLHTNDSASAFTRLLDMGIEAYLVSSSVIAVMAQRLVRVVCPRCKEPHLPAPDQRATLGPSARPETVLYRGKGCSHCVSTGYYGRTGIAELLNVDDETREQIMNRLGANLIKQAAVRKGMVTLRDDGIVKVLAGSTTLDEVLRVTQDDVL
jgi:general secretion pathway protein E